MKQASAPAHKGPEDETSVSIKDTFISVKSPFNISSWLLCVINVWLYWRFLFSVRLSAL